MGSQAPESPDIAAKPRPAGRKRDAGRTRDAILKAAMAEFCRNGLGGARVDAISRRAKANMRLLYHYFGDKDGLYTAVLEHVYKDIRASEQRLNLSDLDPVAGMRELVDFTFTYFQQHQDYIALINNENLLRARFLRKSEQIRSLTQPLVSNIEDLLRRGEAGGEFRSGVDPIQLYVSITALSYFHVSNRHTLSAMFGMDIGAPEWLNDRRQLAQEMVLSWLTARDGRARRTARSTTPDAGSDPDSD